MVKQRPLQDTFRSSLLNFLSFSNTLLLLHFFLASSDIQPCLFLPPKKGCLILITVLLIYYGHTGMT